ncbi:MAG: hypothetical protein U0520_04745 [Candidatus Saccharimonadales bacterium]
MLRKRNSWVVVLDAQDDLLGVIGGAHIAENYYIQIAQEVGMMGVVLFVAIVSLVAVRLYAL